MNPREDGSPHPLRSKDVSRVNSWRSFAAKNKGKHILWNELAMEKYILEKDPSYLSIYKSYNSWIIRCDAFRLFVLYHMGGIYTDIDTEITNPDYLLSLLKTQDILIPRSDTHFKMSWIFIDFKYNNYFLASKQGEDLFHDMYLGVRNYANVLKAGGPYYISEMVSKELDRRKVTDKPISDMEIIPHNVMPVSHTSDKSWFKLQVDAYWKQYQGLIIFSIVVLLCIIVALICAYMRGSLNSSIRLPFGWMRGSKESLGTREINQVKALYSDWNKGLDPGRSYW